MEESGTKKKKVVGGIKWWSKLNQGVQWWSKTKAGESEDRRRQNKVEHERTRKGEERTGENKKKKLGQGRTRLS